MLCILVMHWHFGSFSYEFPRPALVMGIVNVTPDSFSDGGRFLDPAQAVDQGLALAEEGADLIDVGGESTRPGAPPVDEKEENKRILPVIEGLSDQLNIPISVDTMKPPVARAALECGASIINDVQANRSLPTMWETAAAFQAGYVAMHMQGDPGTMQVKPDYENVISEVDRFFEDRLDRLRAAGVMAEQVVLDVGLGFGKNLTHNLQLLAGLEDFKRRGRPLLVGASRKSFIGLTTGIEKPSDRLPGSLACACWARLAGAQIIRTHDVAATRQALSMTEAIMAEKLHGS